MKPQRNAGIATALTTKGPAGRLKARRRRRRRIHGAGSTDCTDYTDSRRREPRMAQRAPPDKRGYHGAARNDCQTVNRQAWRRKHIAPGLPGAVRRDGWRRAISAFRHRDAPADAPIVCPGWGRAILAPCFNTGWRFSTPRAPAGRQNLCPDAVTLRTGPHRRRQINNHDHWCGKYPQ